MKDVNHRQHAFKFISFNLMDLITNLKQYAWRNVSEWYCAVPNGVHATI